METIGSISGATLGYIIGNRKGAEIGYKLGRFLSKKKGMAPVPQKRRASTSGGRPPKRVKNTSGKKKKTRSNLRNANRGLSKKQSQSVKGIVKRQLECDFNHGIYERNVVGVVNPVVDGDFQYVADHAQRQGGNADPFTEYSMRFTPFNAKRLWDAASVLYNGKTRSVKIEDPVNNFDIKGLAVNFTYCSYKLRMRNYTNVIYDVEMIEFWRRGNGETSAKDEWNKSIESTEWVGGSTPGGAAVNGMRPQMFERMKGLYHMKSSYFTLNPGQEHDIFKTFKGCVDFTKVANDDGTSILSFNRKVGTELIFIYRPKLSIAWDTTDLTRASIGHMTGNDDVRNGVLIEVNEVFKCQQPDATFDENEGNNRCILNSYDLKPVANLNLVQLSWSDKQSNLYNVAV